MTKSQIIEYEYCKKHLKCIKEWEDRIPFKMQKYESAAASPKIEHVLENIHLEMYERVNDAMSEASVKIVKMINDL